MPLPLLNSNKSSPEQGYKCLTLLSPFILPDVSQLLPFLKYPEALSCKLADYIGFDPSVLTYDQAELIKLKGNRGKTWKE